MALAGECLRSAWSGGFRHSMGGNKVTLLPFGQLPSRRGSGAYRPDGPGLK